MAPLQRWKNPAAEKAGGKKINTEKAPGSKGSKEEKSTFRICLLAGGEEIKGLLKPLE